MESLSNIDCGNNGELHSALFHAIMQSVSNEPIPSKNLCIICGRYIEDYAHAILPVGREIKHVHHNCAIEFGEYLSVELLDASIPLERDVMLLNFGVSATYTQLIEQGEYYITNLGEQIGRQLIAKGFQTSQILDIRLDMDKDMAALLIKIYVHAKVQHRCMFCNSGRRLVLPPNAMHMWKDTDLVPVNDVMAKEENLLITNDNKYVFHQSCLNEAIEGLKRFTK